MTLRLYGFVALPTACLFLTGCLGTLLGGGKPTQLYRFGNTIPVIVTGAPTAPTVAAPILAILLPVQYLQPQSDRILATNGLQTSYIKDARWIAPAPELFEQSVRNTFRQRAKNILLGSTQDSMGASRVVEITIERFTADYTVDQAPPTITMAIRVVVLDTKSRKFMGSLSVDEVQSASANTVTAVVDAFDIAARRSAIKIVDWANEVMVAPKSPSPTL